MATPPLWRITREVLFIKGSSRPVVDFSPEDDEFLDPNNAIIAITDIARQGVPRRSSFLQYACECYQFSLNESQRSNSGPIKLAEFQEAHEILRNSLISVTQMVLSIHDEYLAEYARSHEDLYKYLKAGALGRQMPPKFWERLCRDWEDDESATEFLTPILSQLTQTIMNPPGIVKNNVFEYATVLEKILMQPTCAKIFLGTPNFLPIVNNASLLEKNSLFLGLLSYRADNGNDAYNNQLFMGFKNLPPMQQMKRLQEFRAVVNSVQESGFRIMSKFFRSKKLLGQRERVLSLLSTIARQNANRKKMRFDERVCSTDGMLTNLSYIMLKLTLPILKGKTKQGKSRMAMIQPEFFMCTPEQGQVYVDYSNDSRISATSKEVEEMAKALGGEKFELNFMTKMLALGLEILHIGLIRSFTTLRNHGQTAAHLDRRGNSHQAEIFRTRSFACIAHYYDSKIIREALVFYNLVGQWILQLAETNPKACSVLPEYIFEDVIAIYGSMSDFPPLRREVKDVYDERALISFCIQLLADNSPCRNIHHRGRLIKVLYGVVPPDYTTKGAHYYSTHVLNSIPEAQVVVPRLLKLYADVEEGDYYTRHSYRYELAIILKFLWLYETHQQAISYMWSSTPDNFIRMINMLINDNIAVLDEALDTLKKLHQLENAEDAGSEDNMKAREETQKRCRSSNQLSLANLELLCWLTQNIQEPFFDTRILGRIATMTNFYLKKLTLEKASLSVSEKEKIKFEPKKLIRCIQTIFLQLSRHKKDFLRAISEDEAYYSLDSYKKALKIFNRLKDSQQILIEFKTYSDEIEVYRNENQDLESRLGEIPDKYLDPMLCTLMRDPVRLPTNDMVMDRDQISIQLLNKSQCPFTKKPLRADELIPVPELKAEIDAWIKQRLAENSEKPQTVETMQIETNVANAV